MQAFPGLPTVLMRSAGANSEVRCTRCGAHVSLDAEHIAAFASEHQHLGEPAPAAAQGLGDLVARATKALGIQPCSPCQARQARLNALLPRFW